MQRQFKAVLIVLGLIEAAILGAVLMRQSHSVMAAPTGSEPPMKLKVGDTAPDFTLMAFDGADLKKVSLHDFKGKKNVALAFYVFAFTGG